jgi:hypothetical protein
MDKIIIPNKIFSRNFIDKKHWSFKMKLRQTYSVLVRNQMRLNKKREVGINEVCSELKITAYLKRLYDFDNLVGGGKQLLDALSHEKFIWDDAPKYLLKLEYKQIRTFDEPYTMIERYLDV